MRNIVVFETIRPDTDPELDWRLERAALPAHSSPLAMVVNGVIVQWEAQEFSWEEVRNMALEQSGLA